MPSLRSKPLPAPGEGPWFFAVLVLIPALTAAIAASQADWNFTLACEAYLVTVFSLAAVQGVAPRAYLRLVEGDLGHPLWVHRGAGLVELCVVALRLRGDTAPAAVLTIGLMGGAAWTWLSHHKRPSRFIPAACVLAATRDAAPVPAYAGIAAYAAGAASAALILRPHTPATTRRRGRDATPAPTAAARRLVAAAMLISCASALAPGIKKSQRRRSAIRPAAAVAAPPRDALDDEDFWRGLRDAVYDGQQAPLPRFDEFCANCQERGPALRQLYTGQVVQRDGHYPGLRADPVWDAPPKWLLGLRLQAPQVADEMVEVLFERARTKAEGGAWRDGFLYGNAPGYRNFECFEVRTATSARRAASFPITTGLLDDLGVPDGPRMCGFGRQRPDSALRVHSDKRTFILTAHIPLDLLHEDDTAPAPDAAELAFRRDLEAQLRLPEEGAGLAFADLDDSLSEPLGNLRAVAQWHDATGRPLPPTLVDTSFPHTAYNRHADRHAYVLLVDVWHPDLSEEERRALALFQAWKLPGGGLKKCFML